MNGLERILPEADVLKKKGTFPQTDLKNVRAIARQANLNAPDAAGNPTSELKNKNGFNIPRPEDSHPSVFAKETRLPSGETITTFMNAELSKTGEELYVMWLNNQVKISGKIVDLYS